MAALNAVVALSTAANVHIELAMDRPPRDLHLILLGDMGLIDRAAAIRADFWQRSVESFIDVLGRFSMRFHAVVRSGLASRFLGPLLGCSLGERRRLPLTGTAGLFQLLLKLIDLSRKLRHPLSQAEACWTGELHEFSVAVR